MFNVCIHSKTKIPVQKVLDVWITEHHVLVSVESRCSRRSIAYAGIDIHIFVRYELLSHSYTYNGLQRSIKKPCNICTAQDRVAAVLLPFNVYRHFGAVLIGSFATQSFLLSRSSRTETLRGPAVTAYAWDRRVLVRGMPFRDDINTRQLLFISVVG